MKSLAARSVRGVLAAILVPAALVCAAVLISAGPAAASTAQPAAVALWHPIPRWHAYLWAIERDGGCPYVWGGNGPCPAGFDCSGLVVDAYAHVGIWLPRTTWEMLGYWRVRQIPWSDARAGDLVFENGGGHVLLYSGHAGWGFGAHSQGHPSGWERLWDVLGVFHVTGAG